jgi:ectoine hydroxylase-related dioxygenase (phytanoyl-CoA dioxygenase family)
VSADDKMRRDHLLDEGYCIVPGILSGESLKELRDITDGLVDGISEEHARRQRSTGSMIPVVRDHRLVRLIAHRPALDALEAMGFTDVRFQSGYIISKPPKSPRLFWHLDWGFWDHPMSGERSPAQVFLMYYLTDTSRSNGCLRVIPRSHLQENPLHDLLANAHGADLTEARDLSRPEFQERPDEVDVPIRAGDLLIGDSRILHASHANESGARRTVVTLWFHPGFGSLPEGMKAGFVTRCDPLPDDWPAESRRLYESLLIRSSGREPPTPFSRERRTSFSPGGRAS